MPKLTGFLAMLFLAGSTYVVHVEMSPFETTVTVPGEVVEQFVYSPLTQQQWVSVHTSQSVPAFATGTSIDDVRTGLIARNLLVLREWPGFMVVREGVPLIDMSGPARQNFLYGFENDTLVLGPLTFQDVMNAFMEAGITPERMEILHLFAGAGTDESKVYNDFAWLLATHPDAGVRDSERAIEYAQRAIVMDELPDWRYVDTLAAAFSAAGDFDNAVRQQQRALELMNIDDEDAFARLRLYQSGEPYIASIDELRFSPIDSGPADPPPKPGLLRDAAAGDVDAQWALGVFYVSNDIDESDGVIAPGLFWLQQAEENGHRYAANEIGFCYMMADCGAAQDLAEAVHWFRRGVEDGDATAAFNLGRLLANGQGAARDELETTWLLTMAADSGIHAAAFSVAFRYGEGLGAEPNYAAQRKYLQQVEAAGFGAADFLLADFYFQQFFGASAIAAALDQSGVRPRETAASLLRIAELLDDAYQAGGENFQVQLSDDIVLTYDSEYGPYLIYNLVRISASLGSRRAQRRMVEYYENGVVVPRSLPEAFYWQQRAER